MQLHWYNKRENGSTMTWHYNLTNIRSRELMNTTCTCDFKLVFLYNLLKFLCLFYFQDIPTSLRLVNWYRLWIFIKNKISIYIGKQLLFVWELGKIFNSIALKKYIKGKCISLKLDKLFHNVIFLNVLLVESKV